MKSHYSTRFWSTFVEFSPLKTLSLMKYNIILLFLPSGHVPKGFQRESYEGVSRSFRTGRQERDLQMIQLSANKCSFIAIL
jgi:hypothetical protein